MATWKVRVVAGPDQDDALIAEIYAIKQATMSESPEPMDLLPLTQERAMRHIQDDQFRWLSILVRDNAGTLVGVADCSLLTGAHQLQCALRVLPPYRRRGVGRCLVSEAARIARAEGRPWLQGTTADHFGPAPLFAKGWGRRRGSRSVTAA